ncbi:hypothetical protein [Burkholderia cenocepacia]|uniref:hypothetical protein n=1 Tax=Burkholderia cenocepacia TaxID=95486 RepID=UPI001B9E2482|nr:hypothetical protein [Burkholderia cenocepacia]MBR8475807.1 hypothetical protein [Burkholderia cenocepacia]
MKTRFFALLFLAVPLVALAQSPTWGIKSNQQLGGVQFTQHNVGTPAKPATECQMKSAYAEFVVSNRQRGLPESAIPDLYGKKLDAAWKRRARADLQRCGSGAERSDARRRAGLSRVPGRPIDARAAIPPSRQPRRARGFFIPATDRRV